MKYRFVYFLLKYEYGIGLLIMYAILQISGDITISQFHAILQGQKICINNILKVYPKLTYFSKELKYNKNMQVDACDRDARET